ncbi:MAG: M48 family metallopeptidase [Planctomycetota bacterium]|nr:M48 family metallopeptidase [Planctomycetota bacterium]
MIQLLVLALALGIFLYDTTPRADASGLPAASALTDLGLMLLAKIALALLLAGAMALCRRDLVRHGRMSSRWLERVGLTYRIAAVTLYMADVYHGGLGLVRGLMGDWVLLDEAVFMAPTLLLLVWAWWCYFPIDQRLRGPALPWSLPDAQIGTPPDSTQHDRPQTRWQYVLGQLRHQVAIVLGPMLALMAWHEIVARLPANVAWLKVDDIRPVLLLAGSGCVFFFAPVMIRRLWDTVPLPDGPVREALGEMCAMHGVRVREMLLWRTFGTMVNAAVMGFLAPVRFILLSDALVTRLPPIQVEAVMAHELAHIRRHHIFWLTLVALASMGLFQAACLQAFAWGAAALPVAATEPGNAQAFAPASDGATGMQAHLDWAMRQFASAEGREILSVPVTMVCWALILGWVSRRFERQADTFAVQHLARRYGGAIDASMEFPSPAALHADEPETTLPPSVLPSASPHTLPATLPGCIDPMAVAAMVEALQQVADLNYIPTRKRSWRHGSIAWRQRYLRTLVGLPIERVSIDRTVVWIKLAVAAALVAMLLWPAARPF